jgi:hypothetical protein
MFGMKNSIVRLALMLSLPFAFLIWGCVTGQMSWSGSSFLDSVILFAASLSIVIFCTFDVVTVSIVYPIWATIVILVTWPALAGHIDTLNHWMMRRTIRLTWYFRPGLSGVTTSSSHV